MTLFHRMARLALVAIAPALIVAPAPTFATDAAQIAGFDLGPEQKDRPRAGPVAAAIAAIPASYPFATKGKLTVGIAPGSPPLATYATDAKTVIGSEVDTAQIVADALGLELELAPTAWADWPLGLVSGKFDVVISNVGVTEERKEKYDFSSYRQGLHGIFVPSNSPLASITEPKDAAGQRVIVALGTNQDRILQRWSKENEAAGLKPLELLYYDDEGARLLALASDRADAIVQPNASLVFIAARDQNIRRVGVLSAGWPEKSDVAIVSRKGSGLAEALSIAINGLIADGVYGKVLARWQLEAEALPASEVNPAGLPKY